MASDRDSIFERVYDKGTIKWLLGLLTAIWLAAFGVVYAKMDSTEKGLRAEIAAVRDDVASVRADVASNGERLARIETLLQERLPPAD